MNRLLLFIAITSVFIGYSQERTANKFIEIVYGGTLTIDQKKYPDATIFSSNDKQQVHFRHQGVDIWCDLAILYQQKNHVEAHGNVFLQQGDSLKMNSQNLLYDGNDRIATAQGNVELRHNNMTLYTEELSFDRNSQIAYYNHFGTIINEENTLTSQQGRYFTTLNKNQFDTQVHIENPSFTINSDQLDYYHNSKHAYLYGATQIQGEQYTIHCKRGFYDTTNEQGHFRDDAKIQYDLKTLEGDSLYFNNKEKFASATNHIRITDTINNVVIKGNYGEIFKEKDSMFITRKALLINIVENDSTYLHAGKIMVTGKKGNRIVKAFPNARIYKTDLQGKCDSICTQEVSGITHLVGKPILWSGENQITGDSIKLLSNINTKQLDSIKVINNVFIIEKDTIGNGFNQVKANLLKGRLENNKLRILNLYQNTETIYYAYSEQKELIGINKLICSRIKITLNENQNIETISFYVNPSGNLYPENKLPENERLMKGFLWRGDERMKNKNDIFALEEVNSLTPLQSGKTREQTDAIELHLFSKDHQNNP